MRVLITSARMPFALDEIRKLGACGHEVVAADTFRAAPGMHSKYVARRVVLPSPRYQPRKFVDAVRRTVERHAIELVVPCFEESFVLAKHAAELGSRARLFAPPFETLARLHSKARFLELARELGIDVPRTELADSDDALRESVRRFDAYFARPSYSRGGVRLLTNTGPLAGDVELDECHPTPENPWLVQEFVPGVDLCSFSVCHEGRIAAHSVYVHPKEIEHAGGIVFESVREPETLEITRRIVEHTRYHGQISFDFRKQGDRMVLIECNPRPTAGVLFLDAEAFVDAIVEGPSDEVRWADRGVKRKISSALVRDMFLHWKEIPDDLRFLFSDAREIYATRSDVMPGIYQVLSYGHVARYRLRAGRNQRNGLMAGYFHDISWNGEPIP